MPLGSPVRLRPARVAVLPVALVALALLVAAAVPTPRLAPFLCTSGAMSDADMAALVAAHFATHPAHGGAAFSISTAVPVDTFEARGFQFNADHNTVTAIDSVHILPGQSVMFKWVSGSHTTTSGNYDDPVPGALWDLPLNSANPSQVVTFSQPGRYPFFCWPHYWYPMYGVIIVDDVPTSTTRSSWGALKARFR